MSRSKVFKPTNCFDLNQRSMAAGKRFCHEVLGRVARFAAQGLFPKETAIRMGIPLDFAVSSLNRSK